MPILITMQSSGFKAYISTSLDIINMKAFYTVIIHQCLSWLYIYTEIIHTS